MFNMPAKLKEWASIKYDIPQVIMTLFGSRTRLFVKPGWLKGQFNRKKGGV
jgi:hypothetical protein